MRDLRNGSVVKNVTRTSARKLWHYAISAKESGALNPSHVSWQGDIGLWRKTHKGGTTRYDLVQRVDGEMHVYYGVTEDGIHGAWRRLIEQAPDSTTVAADLSGQGAPAGEAQPVAALTAPELVDAAEQAVAELVAQEQEVVAAFAAASAEAAPLVLESPGSAEAAPQAAAKGRPRGRSTKKAASKSKPATAERQARKSTKTKAGPGTRSRARRPAESAG